MKELTKKELLAEIERLRDLLGRHRIDPDEDEDEEYEGPDPESIAPSVKVWLERIEAFVAQHPDCTILACDDPLNRLLGASCFVGDGSEFCELHFVSVTSVKDIWDGPHPPGLDLAVGRQRLMERLAAGKIFSGGVK